MEVTTTPTESRINKIEHNITTHHIQHHIRSSAQQATYTSNHIYASTQRLSSQVTYLPLSASSSRARSPSSLPFLFSFSLVCSFSPCCSLLVLLSALSFLCALPLCDGIFSNL